jgi:hypothetical protein
MENFRKLRVSVLCLSFGALTMVSCIKSTPVALQGVADVIIQDMKTDAGIKYGIYVYASANYDIASAKVTAPGTPGKIYQLTATSNKMQFVYYPTATDYTSDMPVKGDYSIEIVTAAGETLTGKDVIGDEKLTPIVIKTATMASQKLKTTWDKVTGADAYVVKLYSANKAELLFSSSYLTSDAVDFEFSSSSSGWAYGVSPVLNTNYVVELLGVKVETGVTIDQANNLQFITVDSKTIKWE